MIKLIDDKTANTGSQNASAKTQAKASKEPKKAKFGNASIDSLSVNGLGVIGMLISIIGFGGFILWGTQANLSKGVSAQGTVVVEGKRKTVQHLEGGIISEILVKDGDKVKAGQVLIRLDETQIQSQATLYNVRLYTALATLDRLFAEQNGDKVLTFRDELENSKNDENVSQILTVQQTLFEARRDQLEGRASILAQTIEQLDETKLGLESQKNASIQQLAFLDEELERSKELVARKIVSLNDITLKRRDKAKVEGEIGALSAQISGTSVTQGEAKLEILQLQKAFAQEVAQQILENREKVFDLKSQIVAVNDVIKRMSIIAPQSGTIIGQTVFTIGGVVPPASPLLEIVPEEDKLVIEAKISTIDIDNIFISQKVRVRMSAFKMRSTPLLEGEVVSISPDVITDKQTGENYYVTQISLPQEEKDKIDEDILPGMPAEILIETGSRTPLEYMLEPLESVIERALNED